MKFLLKILCLVSLLSSFGFSEVELVKVLNSFETNSLREGGYEYSFLKGKKYLNYKFSEYDINVVRPVLDIETYYILDRVLSPGFYSHDGNLFLVDGVYNTGKFSHHQSVGIVDFSYFGSGDVHNYTLAYLISLARNDIYCKYSENPGIKSEKCFPACPAGQSWDYENEVCYFDCSDKNLNKFGYSNGTAQGGCVDCSSAFTDHDIASCICSGFGTTLSEKGTYFSLEGSSFVSYSCANGSDITFKRRSNENADKDKKNDNNSTNSSDKDKENPKPDKDKDKKNDNNSTNSSNKDNKKEDTKSNKKDNNENSNNSSGESGNSSNNNSGGSAGNGSSGVGGTGVETKLNPNSGNGKQDGKGDGKEDGKGEEGKGDDAEAQKLDYGDLEKDAVKFEGEFKKAVDDSFSFVNDVKASLTDTLQKIKDGNLMSLKKGAVPTTCPLSFQIDMTYFSKNLTFDFCKIVSPVSSSLYILFYLGFFILFLVVIIKLFILTFMGW